MSNNIKLSAARIAREVPATEASLDSALLSVSHLISALVQARQDSNVPPSTGQATLLRLAKAQMSLVAISSDVLRVHKDLFDLNTEHAGLDVHECPENGSLPVIKPTLAAVA